MQALRRGGVCCLGECGNHGALDCIFAAQALETIFLGGGGGGGGWDAELETCELSRLVTHQVEAELKRRC